VSDKPAMGTASPMPIQGSGCGIRPTEEALEVNYGVDFSAAAKLLAEQQNPVPVAPPAEPPAVD
jgi:hypothetical protein